MTDESVRAARDAYNDAIDKAWVASGKAFKSAGAGDEVYFAARDAFATAYAELNYAQCAYATAIVVRCPTTTTEDTTMTDETVARESANAAAISAIDKYELAIADARYATSRDSCYMAFNDVITAARAARDAIDAAYAAAEENPK